MFRIAYRMLLFLFILLLVACGGSKGSEEKSGGLNVDKGLRHVEITFPAVLFEGEDTDEIIENAKEEGASEVTVNEDGSITYKIPKAEHKKMMKEMEENILNLINETRNSDELPSIKDITYKKDFSTFTFIVEREAYENSFDGFASLTFGISGVYYQVFQGKKAEDAKVKISVQDEATGEVFHESVFPDALEEQQEE